MPDQVQLVLDQQRTIGGLQVVRFRQEYKGLPVIDRGAALVFDGNGAAKLATSMVEDALPSSVVPKIASAEAAISANAVTGLAASSEHTRLLILPTPEGGKLVYSVLPPSLIPFPYAPLVLIDAVTGRVISVRNLVQSKNMANVFAINPVRNNSTIQVQLPVGDGLTVPVNDLLVSYNCVDTHKVTSVDVWGYTKIDMHLCELLQNAVADSTNGDFLQYKYVDDTSGGDPFAQISIFYHASKAFEYFRELDSSFKLLKSASPLMLVSNVMFPQGYDNRDLFPFWSDSADYEMIANPDLPLAPYDNAFYMAAQPYYGQALSIYWPELTGGVIAFGQGQYIDYSYDAATVYHEFTHAVVHSTINLGSAWHLDAQGGSCAPGAMNEGFADYFAAAISGDPSWGGYLDSGMEGGYSRSLENGNICPTDLVGESHTDSQFFAAALWDTRVSLPSDADRLEFDRAIYTAMSAAVSGNVSFEAVAELLVAAVDASPLGEVGSAGLRASFAARGLLPACDRTFVYNNQPIYSTFEYYGYVFVSAGKDMMSKDGIPYAPGTFQVEVPLRVGTTDMDISFWANSYAQAGYEDYGFIPALLVSFDEPLSFNWRQPEPTESALLDVRDIGDDFMAASIEVPEGASKAYVMVVNKGRNDGYFTFLDFTVGGDFPDDEPDDMFPGDGGNESGTGMDTTNYAGGGCGCRMGTAEPWYGAWILGLLGLGVVGRQRRRWSIS